METHVRSELWYRRNRVSTQSISQNGKHSETLNLLSRVLLETFQSKCCWHILYSLKKPGKTFSMKTSLMKTILSLSDELDEWTDGRAV